MLIKELLLSFADITVESISLFDGNNLYRRSFNEYRKWRKKNNIESTKLYRLKKFGFIEKDNEGIYLTDKAIKRIQKISLNEIKIVKPDTWDKKWRIVIFDIPESKKMGREVFRNKLKELGFISLQKSVFCYPFECLKEITQIVNLYELAPYVTYLEADKINTNTDVLKRLEDLVL